MPKQSPKPLNLKAFLPYRLSVLTNMISRNLGNMYSERFDLSIAEWRVMAVLGQDSDISADAVCAHTEMDKVSVSRAVTKLLDKQYIDRKFSTEDRRRSILRLSRSGYAVYTKVVPIVRQYEKTLFQGLSKTELDQFNRLLDKINHRARSIFHTS